MRILVLIVLGSFLTWAPSAPSAAQTTQQVVAQAAASAEKKAIIATAMELGEEEAKVFWPVYDEFQAGLEKLDARLAAVIQTYADSWRSMDDETAKGVLTEYLDIEKDRNALRSSFVKRFRKALPEAKVLRYYQLENKLDATVRFMLADKVPLTP